MFNKRSYSNLVILLLSILIYGSNVFAGPTVSDVPSSESEVRTVQNETTIYNGMCDITQNLVFYDGSPVYLRVAQPKTVVNYVFDKAMTYVRVYGGNIFAGSLKFPYISNFIPSTTLDTENTTILSVVAKDSTFLGQESKPRNEVAGQFVTKNFLRTLVLSNAGSLVNYYFRYSSDNSFNNGNMNAILNPNATEKTSCTNYYVARCGDNIVDKATGTTDGNGGIQTASNGFLPWHELSIKPAEECDLGNQNGVPGSTCSSDCKITSVDPINGICHSNSYSIVVPDPNTTKSADIVCYGQGGDYTITIKNSAGQIVDSSVGSAGNMFSKNFGNLPEGTLTAECSVAGINGGSAGICNKAFTVQGPVTALPVLTIKKTLVGDPGKLYVPGDTVQFRIDFSNIGSGLATNVEIKDVLPRALEYEGIEIYGITPPYLKSEAMDGPNLVVIYSGFTLTQGQSAYIIVTGKAKSYAFADQTLNNSFASSSEFAKILSNAIFNYGTPTANVTINKTLTTAGNIYPGSTVGFRISVTNNGPEAVNNVQISDVWPSGPCISSPSNYVSNIYLQPNGNLNWTLPGTFAAGQTVTIDLTGAIVDAPACATQQTNIGNLSYNLVNTVYTGQSVLNFTILPKPYGNMEIMKTIKDKKEVYAKGDIVTYEIVVKNIGTASISNYNIVDHRPATLEFISSTPMPFVVPSCSDGCDLTWNLNGLAAGAEYKITISGKIK